MQSDTEITEPKRQYAAAYAAHYTGRDLLLALQLYKQVVASYPSDPEAEYGRMQIQNIAHAVVPKQELLDAQIELVLAHFEHDRLHDEARVPVAPLASRPLA